MPPAAPATPSTDIRATRPYLLSGTPIRAAARRIASAMTLVFLDIAGLALGLYAALALRELYHGKDLLWGILWKAEQEWLPFVALVTLLVFWKAGLYADRERRAGGGRVISSLVLSALLVVAFALGHPFGATGARLILTLAHEMKRRGVRYGLASACAAGGNGAAIVLEAA